MRKLADEVHYSKTPFYYMLACVLLCPIWQLVAPLKTYEEQPKYGIYMYLMLIASALCLMIQQVTITNSMKYNTVGMV